MERQIRIMDGNEAAASVAYKTNEVISIYPITPASPMGEHADQWSDRKMKNIWGTVPHVAEMQSEGGAAGAVHGALQNGALTTTFTASQGLLLMLPNMFKIAGELTSTVFHIAARSVAAQALSIFGDHSDVMAARTTGYSFLFSNSVQEAMDMALISQMSTLKTRIPFLHIFDGFRTSHELQKITTLSDEDIRALIDDDLVQKHRARSMSPDRPFIRGTAQNPDAFFQARESVNPYYISTPELVQQSMDEFARQVGRQYKLFDYVGHPEAERIMVLMGSGSETAHETIKHLSDKGEKVGLIKVRLYRPFSTEAFLKALPKTVKAVTTLDRTKEPGASGEPLYLDISNAIREGVERNMTEMGSMPKVTGGRYGLSSKEFTPAMIKGLMDELGRDMPKNHYTVGINDDLTHTHINYDPSFNIEPEETTRAVFWGLGSDGTVGANKNSIKIIGEETDMHAQGYFVYDSKKAGARTISHLRFGTEPIRSTYLIDKANFVAVHQFGFLERYDTLSMAEEGATFLLNAPFEPDEVWDKLPQQIQETILEKNLKFYTIDAYKVAKELGLGIRINTIMQTCFFAISNVLPRDRAIEEIKKAIKKTYGKRGEAVVNMNYKAVDAALEHLHEVEVPGKVTSNRQMPPTVPEEAPDFVQNVTAKMIAGHGDDLPVSAFPVDGTYPSGTTQWEKRNIAQEIPVWDPDICIQCGKCVMACPHSVIRAKVFEPEFLENAPETFKATDARWKDLPDMKYSLQVAPEDCTGCTLCVEVCPAKDKQQTGRKAINMEPQFPIREQERENWKFFTEELPESKMHSQPELDYTKAKDVQLLDPTFEFSSACAGCGETPYLKLLSQMFGDRSYIANATGCSSIYGGNLPTTPWSQDKQGRGPTWNNSLFEDNAEFGLGMRLAYDKKREYAVELLQRRASDIGKDLAREILEAKQEDSAAIEEQRSRIEKLKEAIGEPKDNELTDLKALADNLAKKDVWIVGGDGWAYDIGYGGLDHVIASGRNVNILVLDTEVYSNTGGQASKATSLGAVAKFAAGGKPIGKKDFGAMAMDYGNVYVAQVAMGANENQTIKAFQEAEAYDGPSIIFAYSHCIAHGIDMAKGFEQQELASKTGYWPLYRFDPRRRAEGKNPLQLDSKKPKKSLDQYMYNENRFSMLKRAKPEKAKQFLDQAQQAVLERWNKLEALASDDFVMSNGDGNGSASKTEKSSKNK